MFKLSQSTTKEKFENAIRIVKDLDLSGPIDLLKVYSSPPRHMGGFGKVYTVHSEAGKLAVKLISIDFCCTNPGNSNKDDLKNKRALMSAREELKRWHDLSGRHDNILSLRGYLLDENMTVLGLVSDYMENGTLRDYIKNYDDSPASEVELFSLIMGVAKGLKAIHETNIIHRDIKSSNILISDDRKALISDFGLSRLVEATTTYSISKSGVCGSARWMSPEQIPLTFDQLIKSDARNDVWSFGMVVYECISGNIPYCKQPEYLATLYILLYKLPSKPTDMTPLQEKLWELCLKCWSRPESRLNMDAVVTYLNTIEEIL